VSWSLQRRLGTADAVVLGLSAMLGTGVFAVWAPAAGAAGSWLLLAVLLAGVVAMCNAASTADLAVAHPESGGGFVYGRERLSHGAGRLAGVAFLVGKTASAAAAAGVFGAYVLPSHPLPTAILVIVAATVLNTAGVRWTARGAYALVGGTLAVLLVVVVVGLFGTQVDPVASAATPDVEPVAIRGGVIGVLTAAGLVFFAFAGYARIATMGEEVRDPERTIPRAIVLALGIAVAAYAAVGVTVLAVLGADQLAGSSAPLVGVARSTGLHWTVPVVAVGGAAASLGALLALIAGIGRTTLAMAREADLPHWLSAVHPVYRVPHRAEIAVAAVVTLLVLTVDLRGAIGFSSFGVLLYYLTANISAYTQERPQRRFPKALQILGAIGCVVLVAALPWQAIVGGVAVFALGATYRAARALRARH
jgi:basic amino acid/polyamine antiporter, APA family